MTQRMYIIAENRKQIEKEKELELFLYLMWCTAPKVLLQERLPLECKKSRPHTGTVKKPTIELLRLTGSQEDR